ncbi:MAG TPA: YeeE/YedE thiosulfate transporter family protein, partial [Methylococcales bacterium]
MGPLVPFIISNEFNLIIALIAGIGFGFVLEQAGFSSTKKLVGLFYGYDFTVLKVFFTAGITAMIGVLLLGHWGLLDLSLIYINPTFLWSALLGGAIMGVGFIIGGFCPGTGVCAAAIGKLDGMAFVFGTGLGVLAFAEGYPMFEKIYLSEAWGGVLMSDMLGMSKIV